MPRFKIKSNYKPAGDQPKAIEVLTRGLVSDFKKQTLLGVTGSGKSVVADTLVYIKIDDIIKCIKIGSLITELFVKYKDNIKESHGRTEILSADDVKEEIFACSFDPNTKKSEWKRILQFVRHLSPDKLYEVTSQCGRTVVVTGDHNFFVFRDEKMCLVRTDEIITTDRLPLPRKLDEPVCSLTNLDLIKYLSKQRKYYLNVPTFSDVYKCHGKEINDILGKSKCWSIVHKNERIKLSEFQELFFRFPDLIKNATIGSKISRYQFPTSFTLDDVLLRLIGYYIGEGHAEKNYIILSTGDKEVMKGIFLWCKRFGLHFHHRPGTFDYQISSSVFTDLLKEWCGDKSKNKHLPSFWPQLSNRQLSQLLSAYFSADGCVNTMITVSCATVSGQLAAEIAYALLRFGIVGRIKKRLVRIPNTQRKSDVWEVQISGQEFIHAFSNNIGFTIKRKNISLGGCFRDRTNTNVDILPVNRWFRKVRMAYNISQKTLALGASVNRSYISMIETGSRPPSREVFDGLFRVIKKESRKNLKFFDINEIELVGSNSELFWSKICSVKETPGVDYVYDFAVEDNETFLAGSGGLFVHNTFTIANVIEKVQMPTLVIAHNKTLAAQLCNEFRDFFPDNAVEYFVSYYDYYQPEAYIPHSDTYIEKEAQINEEIDRLRHACTQALLSRPDVIIVASVSAIYGLGSPKEYERIVLHLRRGQALDRRGMMEQLISMQFTRTNAELKRGTFLMRGQVFEIMPINEEMIYRFEVSDKIERIEWVDPVTRKVKREIEDAWFFPARHYVVSEDLKNTAFSSIQEELEVRLAELEKEGKVLEHERLKRRVRYDLEMIKNLGYCNGIENYSRHFDGRSPGEPPFTLLDYFTHGAKKQGSGKFLTVIDESHVTIPQLRGMYAGDKSRKDVLIEHGFRLPSARDNRPLQYTEFGQRVDQVIYVSATPDQYELSESEQVVEQIVRPTGLIDPEIIIQPVTGGKNNKSQVEDLMERIVQRVGQNERALVTTLTKKMAEDLSEYLKEKKMKVRYLHSDIDTLERIEVITDLRLGKIDVIVGVNLLREGLDMPEVSLVGILDADKEGFLRSATSLIQTIGRAARNVNGQVILYADVLTGSIKKAIEETSRRRVIQLKYNKDHGITPKTIEKTIRNILEEFGIRDKTKDKKTGRKTDRLGLTDLDTLGDARPLEEIIKDKERQMKEAAQDLEFELAAILRDELRELRMRVKVRK